MVIYRFNTREKVFVKQTTLLCMIYFITHRNFVILSSSSARISIKPIDDFA